MISFLIIFLYKFFCIGVGWEERDKTPMFIVYALPPCLLYGEDGYGMFLSNHSISIPMHQIFQKSSYFFEILLYPGLSTAVCYVVTLFPKF